MTMSETFNKFPVGAANENCSKRKILGGRRFFKVGGIYIVRSSKTLSTSQLTGAYGLTFSTDFPQAGEEPNKLLVHQHKPKTMEVSDIDGYISSGGGTKLLRTIGKGDVFVVVSKPAWVIPVTEKRSNAYDDFSTFLTTGDKLWYTVKILASGATGWLLLNGNYSPRTLFSPIK